MNDCILGDEDQQKDCCCDECLEKKQYNWTDEKDEL